MKNPVAAIGTISNKDVLNGVFASFMQSAGSVARTVFDALRSVIVEMQVSRMQSVIASLTDEQLSYSGKSREELRAQARSLVTNTGK